mmetsp:Transcript_16680/g.23074  ORF Transcript_16680/g.23074 Transcript_16680/m.23074 type:complete len:317 (+) Transcript_16680:64-1014(+)|eukprot:CAMPEP_0201491424 /NCGR_PEP_ID=MMETSP0151_2-20130828/29772_1 /ASSEMBLY_ACC=CAM_ASM_000257 /TAXON_ID=200890 /ORGANISM="Paramoeba atlantica, Strain 621/1 / CCAP 1560/9" /LENGTH=316 /DNA_ID=CAMNT_0047877775 /DNA_START=52 /DNA_END=1002 /DNA_ORIENTATION=-
MGNFLSLRQSKQDPVDIVLDFENAQPQSEEEKLALVEIIQVLDKAPSILEKLKNYTGCQEVIRRAITSPTVENEDEAWQCVIPAALLSKEFYDYSLELADCFPKILKTLCQDDPKKNLEKCQALSKQFANVFDFVMRFDDLKMLTPAIPNDFSYFRRTSSRMKVSKMKRELPMKDEIANKIALFLAFPTPMMNTINETSANFLFQDSTVPSGNVTTALSLIASVCEDMVTERRFEKEETNMFCLRCMTGAIIMFDHLNPQGAFHKRSGIPIKGCVTSLKAFQPSAGSTDGLLNALRFTTIHLNDPETPSSVKALFD